MKYQQPFDQTNPNAPYVDGNPATSTPGSIPRGKALEGPQREIVYCITQAGGTPDENNNTQLWQAIQAAAGAAAGTPPANSSYFHFGTAAGTATALTANVTPDIAGYAQGYVYSILTTSASANGGTTANFDSRGNRTVTRADGTPIQKGDWGAGQGVLFFDDGTNLQLFGVLTSSLPTTGILIYSASTSYTVPAGVTKIKRIRCWGAGGGGGGSIGTGGAGSGGGGGGYSESVALDVVPGQILTITVGQPGTGGVSANGTAGGTSSVGIQGQSAWLAATGGGFGGGGNSGPQTSLAGAGGVGSGGQLNGTGGTGSYGYSFGSQVGSGIGGASPFGAGSPTLNVNTGSSPGNFPGGGANGGCGGSNGTNGGAGLVIMEI